MHPLGWDSFGLPAENAAIKNGIHPAVWTRSNIQEMKGQIQKMGISYDWDREIATFLPEYYRWNQWFFLKMWERGDVFRALRNVNWCEALGTVLANEQVVDGKDERTGHPVVQKPMEQYFFAITQLRRRAAGRARPHRLAGERQGHAAALDRQVRGGPAHLRPHRRAPGDRCSPPAWTPCSG